MCRLREVVEDLRHADENPHDSHGVRKTSQSVQDPNGFFGIGGVQGSGSVSRPDPTDEWPGAMAGDAEEEGPPDDEYQGVIVIEDGEG